jgi:hypothetical protein
MEQFQMSGASSGQGRLIPVSDLNRTKSFVRSARNFSRRHSGEFSHKRTFIARRAGMDEGSPFRGQKRVFKAII